MKMKNPMQMKSLVKNKAKESGMPADVVLHMYVMERFLDRLSRSDYRDMFVLKGGYLLFTMWGMGERTTSDLDLTSKTLDVDEESTVRIFGEICSIDADDGFEIAVVKSEPVAEVLEHPGIRVFMNAKYGVIERFYADVVPSLDIVPEETIRGIEPIFGGDSIDVLTYRIETVIAEKLHAALTRGVNNTRMRDYYDFYIIDHRDDVEVDPALLNEAVMHTFSERGTTKYLEESDDVLSKVCSDEVMNDNWNHYRDTHPYASEISFEDTCKSALRLIAAARSGIEKP